MRSEKCATDIKRERERERERESESGIHITRMGRIKKERDKEMASDIEIRI